MLKQSWRKQAAGDAALSTLERYLTVSTLIFTVPSQNYLFQTDGEEDLVKINLHPPAIYLPPIISPPPAI
ncbi:MAG: hypothetical protein R2825_18875 [Saprospiraceae bacterium]